MSTFGKIKTQDGAGNDLTSTTGALDVNVKTSALTDPTEVAQGTTAPSKVVVVGGKSNDGTPQYKEVPLGAGCRSIIVEGVVGGTAQPVSGTFYQSTQPVSLASLPALAAGSAVIGHVINDASSAVIGHVIVDSGAITAAATLAAETTKVIGTVNVASSQTIAVTSGTAANCKVAATLDAETTKVIGTVNVASSQTIGIAAGTAAIGTVKSQPAAPTAATYTSAVINFSGSGDNTIVAGVGGQTVRIYKIQFTVAGATNVKFGDTTVTYMSGAYVLTGNGSSFSDWMNGEPLFVTATGKGFLINSSVAVSVQGIVHYTVS